MSSEYDPAANRRRFLQYLAASPLLATGGAQALAETILPKSVVPDPLMWGPRQSDHLIKTPKDAVNVFDFEPVCRQNVPPAHFGYMASGIDDEVTLRANREGFLKFQLRPRRPRRRYGTSVGRRPAPARSATNIWCRECRRSCRPC